MSHTITRITPQDFAPPAVIDRMRSRSIIVGAVFAVLAVVGAIIHWEIFLRAWLFSFMFWLGLTTGSLALLCLQYTSGGNWGRLGRRIWEAGAGNWWLMALFWLPIGIGMKSLFAWTRDPGAGPAHDAFVADYGADKLDYDRDTPFFWGRAGIYFAGWAII